MSQTERRTRTRVMINELIKQRQDVLITLCELAEVSPFPEEKPNYERIQDFCQIFVDYIALGHFEIFDRIMKKEERRKDVLNIISSLYLRIAFTTEVAIEFNDKYESPEQSLDHLHEDLTKLSEIMATRIDMEDQLIEALLPAKSIIQHEIQNRTVKAA